MFLYRRDKRGIVFFAMAYMLAGFILANVGLKIGGLWGSLVFLVGAGVLSFVSIAFGILVVFFWDRIRLPAPSNH